MLGDPFAGECPGSQACLFRSVDLASDLGPHFLPDCFRAFLVPSDRMSQMARWCERGSGKGRPVETSRPGTSQALPSLAAPRQNPFASELSSSADLTAGPGCVPVLACTCVCSTLSSSSARGAPPPGSLSRCSPSSTRHSPSPGPSRPHLCGRCFCVLLCLASFFHCTEHCPFPGICSVPIPKLRFSFRRSARCQRYSQ